MLFSNFGRDIQSLIVGIDLADTCHYTFEILTAVTSNIVMGNHVDNCTSFFDDRLDGFLNNKNYPPSPITEDLMHQLYFFFGVFPIFNFLRIGEIEVQPQFMHDYYDCELPSYQYVYFVVSEDIVQGTSF